MDTATPTPTKKLTDLSFAERGKFLIEKYKLINGQKMDPLEAEAKTRVAFGLTPLTEAEQQQIKDKNIVEKIVDSTPLQVIGASAIIHKTWDKYINGAKDLATEKLETAKTAAQEKIETAKESAIAKATDLKEQAVEKAVEVKESAKEKVVTSAQTAVTTAADKVGLKTEPTVDSPESAFINPPAETTAVPTLVTPVATASAIAANTAPQASMQTATVNGVVSPSPSPITNTTPLIETEAQKTAVFDRVPVEAQAVAMSPNAEM